MSGVTTYFHQFRKDEGDQTRTDSYTPSRGQRIPRSSTSSHISSDRPSSTFPAKAILPDEYPKKPQPQASSTRTHRDGNPDGNFGPRHQSSSAYGSPRPSERHPESMQYSYDEQRYQHSSYGRSRSPPSTADRYDHPDHSYYRSASPPMSDRQSSYGSLAYSGVDTVEAEAGNILISLANQTVPPLQMNVTSRPQTYDASASRDYDYRRSTENRSMSEVEVAATIQSLSNPQSHQRYPPTPAQSTSSQSTSSKNSSMSIKNLLGDESSATSPIAPSPPQRSVEAQYREYQPYQTKSGDKDRPFLNLTYSNATKQYDSGTQDVMVVDQRYNAMAGTTGSKKPSRRPAPPGSVDEGMSQPKILSKDSRSVQKRSSKRKSVEASPQDHPSSKPKMIHNHSSPNMPPYHRHEKGEGPLAAPANISGSPSGGSAFHDAVHPHKGDDHRVMDYDRQRSYHSRHLPPSDDQPRRVPVKTEDHVEGNISSWNSSDKGRDYGYRQHPRARDSPSPPRGHPSEQGKPINIKAYHPASNDRMVGYAGPQAQHHWIDEQNPHEFGGYGQPKGPYDSKTSPMQMPQPSGFGPQSNGVRAEGHSAFNRSYYTKYTSMKQDPKLKRNAMHAYITYMIYTDQTQKPASQQTITPSSSRESYSGPIGGPPSHPAPPRSRSSSVPMPPQSGSNSAPGASYSSYSGAREPHEQYQYAAQPLGPSPSMGYRHPVYDDKRSLSAPTQRSPTLSSARPSQPLQSPYANQYAPAPAPHHSRNRTPEHSPTIAPHHPSMNLRRPSESDPISRGPPGAAQAPPTTLPPLSGPPHHHHHHHHSPAHHHHHHYPDGPPNPHAHTHSAPPPPHHAPYWSQAPYSPPTASQTLAPPLHHSYSSPSPGSNSAPNGRVPPNSMPPAPYPAQHIPPSNSLPPPSTLTARDRDASFAGAGSSPFPQPTELPDRGNPAGTIPNQPQIQYLRPNTGPSGGPRREETDRPPTSAGHPEAQLPPITTTVAPGAPVSSGPTRSNHYPSMR
ncbi:hypothetical protein BC937DRAFT_93616 [Endogone sp. FLAS-F59071]|nr:hypothetical protein BC937DRAFT_93616 [Endogone sp. FLAS-F59071]|eukprot:RUS14579.1 hypothetical protein BC937DRAFT_93616 [Endogone sp. FLAS-F59071]